MSESSTQADDPTFGQWVWLSGIAGLIGQVAIAAVVFFNISTIFDYNGKPTGEEMPSSLEWMLLFTYCVDGAICTFLLRRAWLAKTPGAFSIVHVIPLLFAAWAIVFAILALLFIASYFIG
jgi:hypothetical protein